MQKGALKDIPKAYDPKSVEGPIYKFWIDKGFFAPKVDPSKKPFTIIMPPPNVTGELHMGHALTAALEDLMARWHRMKGEPTLWLPGADHAGIATQVVVERMLTQEGLSRHQLGRDRFLQRAWEWVKKYGSIIDEQHKRLGVSADWSRKKFTLDEGPSKAVQTTFLNLYNKGLIYRGERIINWCPRCATALSELEVVHQEAESFLYYIHYKLVDGDGSVIVATTRPETLLGDTAVAVNPKDKRHKNLVGKNVVLPVLKRHIPIIADAAVSLEFGTGALKVTPGHDPVDFEIGQCNSLPLVNVMNLDGTINENGGHYNGMERFEARRKIVEELKETGLLEKIEPYQHSVGHCQRCQTSVEPLVSKQWFLKMEPLAKPAIEAVANGRIRIVPERFIKVYMNWMENIHDWCISRQLWWGHRIPVWYCAKCDGEKIKLVLSVQQDFEAVSSGQSSKETDTLFGFLEKGMPLEEIDRRIESTSIEMDVQPIVSLEPPTECPNCGDTGLFQDPDVLDTWFSSGLWTHSTLGWPDKTEDLAYFYPTSVMETGYDILFFWVARMIMMGIENMGDIPFHTVYLHGLIRDVQGVKMSKTRGNVMDPLEVIEKYGTDALRFALTTGNTPGNDMRISEGKLESSRNFANKLWNASRFVITNIRNADNLEGWRTIARTEHLEDRWIVSRLNRVIEKVNRLMDDHQFGEAQRELYEFIWSEYCDWYIEMAKIRIRSGNSLSPLPVLANVLEKVLLLLHPFMPFITEEIWQTLVGSLSKEGPQFDSIMTALYPDSDPSLVDEEAEEQIDLVMRVVRSIRNLRAEFRIETSRTIEAVLNAPEEIEVMKGESEAIKALARVSPLKIGQNGDIAPSEGSVTLIIGKASVVLPLGGVVDLNKEQQRLEKELSDCEANIHRLDARLSNPDFLEKAPAEVVEKERERRASIEDRRQKLHDLLQQLSS